MPNTIQNSGFLVRSARRAAAKAPLPETQLLTCTVPRNSAQCTFACNARQCPVGGDYTRCVSKR